MSTGTTDLLKRPMLALRAPTAWDAADPDPGGPIRRYGFNARRYAI